MTQATRAEDPVAAALSAAAAAIASADELALACHVTPDGDALGSMLALHHLAVANGKTVVSSWPDPFVSATIYRSLPGLDLAVPSAQFPKDPACMLTFDCGSLSRLNELGGPARAAAANAGLLVVDHHVTNGRYGTINLIDPDAAATAIVVRNLARELGWTLTREAAYCLYVGLATDTGRFQHGCTSAAVFAFAAELAGFDLPISKLSRELFSENRFTYLKLAARALDRAILDTDLAFVYTSVTTEDQRAYGVTYEEIESLIEWIRSTAEAEVACVLKQTPDGFRVSLRSVSGIDVGAIASALGGGGHRLASGFTMDASVEEIVAALKTLLRAQRHPA